jgi:hypothetical protein
MADNSIVQGLFGIDPAMYQMQQQANQEAQAAQFAQLTGAQQGQYGAFRGGQQLAGIGANLMGMQDPVLAKASMAKQLANQFDLTSPQGLQQYAQALAQNGAPDLAQMAVARAQDMQVKQATIYQKSGENLNSLIASGKFTPESLAKFQQTRNAGDLEVLDKGLTGSNKEKVAAAIEANTMIESGTAEIGNYRDMLKKGEVQYGPLVNLSAKASAAVGSPSQNALKQQEIESFLTGQINEVLNAAKGVQAKDDALRAERQIKGYLAQNSNEGMDKALELLEKTKNRVKAGNEAYINSLTGETKKTTAPTTKPSINAIFSAVRAKKGWEDATDAEIQQGISNGTIKVPKQ